MSGDVQVRFCERPGVRFPRATHLVVLFEREDDARRVHEVLPKRFAKYGLTLHPEKTRLVEFQSPVRRSSSNGDGRPGTFDLLGFTHYWAKSLRGAWVVKRRTARDRFRRSLGRVVMWCRTHRHDPVGAQQRMLASKLRGHYGYYGVVTNSGALVRFYRAVVCAWRKWLSRRSQRAYVTWERMHRLLGYFPLPQPRLPKRAT